MYSLTMPEALPEVGLLLLCAAGLTVTLLARISQGSGAQLMFQRLFLASLGLVCLGTALAVRLMPGSWFAMSGMTCAAMIVATVFDSGMQTES